VSFVDALLPKRVKGRAQSDERGNGNNDGPMLACCTQN